MSSIAHPCTPERHLSLVAPSTPAPPAGRLEPDDLPRPPRFVLASGRHTWMVDQPNGVIYVSDQLDRVSARHAMAEATAWYFTQDTRPQLVSAGG